MKKSISAVINLKTVLLVWAMMIFVSACKTDKTTKNELALSKESVIDEATAKEYIVKLKSEISHNKENRISLLQEGLRVSEEYKLGSAAVSFLMPLIKDYPDDPDNEERLAKLSSALSDLGRKNASSILGQAYYENYPNGKFKGLLENKLGKELDQPKNTLKSMAEAVFENPDKFGINRGNAQRYVDACEAFALGYPKDGETPMYLYRGAEMARTLKTFNKALSIYDWIFEKYPDHEKTPTTLFLKGFMLENELNDKDKAKEIYNQFLKIYPDHELSDDIQFLLENIDKSDKEIMEMIESQKK